MYKLFVLLVIVSAFAGCSSSSSSSEKAPAGNDTTPKTSNTSVSSAPENTSTDNANLTATRAEVMARLRQKSLDSANAPSSAPLPKPQFRPAPDNSVMATTMDKEGAVIETRIFKNNPQIAKVELKWVGPKDSILKIFLKNGRVVDAKDRNIENLGTISVADLLQMAGVK